MAERFIHEMETDATGGAHREIAAPVCGELLLCVENQ
jgi:hypothetical protein